MDTDRPHPPLASGFPPLPCVTQQLYATGPTPQIPPPPQERSAFRRLLTWTTLSLALVYGGSTYAALVSQRYGDFFIEKVPGGSQIMDVVEDSPLGQKLKTTNVSELTGQAIGAASSGYERVSGAVGRVVGSAKDKVEDLQESGKEALESDKIQHPRQRAGDMVRKVEKKLDEADVKSKAETAVEEVKSKSEELVNRAKQAASNAESKLEKKGGAARDKVEDAASSASARAKSSQPYGRDLPLNHEAPAGYSGSAPRDRGVRPDPEHQGRLRDPPELPKLPRLAPSIGSLSGSEPMIAQLADTIDDLAAFVREAPASAGNKATGVLDEAKRELSRLYERLETVKKNEAAKLQKGLEAQKQKYDAALKKAADDAEAKVSKVDEAYKKKQEELRKSEAAEFASKLKAELETQSQIINERLKEEVVQQGVEMQRRWTKEIKARVEAERGGRLAKLDELAKDLDSIQKISLENSQALEESASTLALGAALRDLSQVALLEADEAGTKRSYKKELDLVKRATAGNKPLTEDAVLQAALGGLESARPEDGVESFSTLYGWFSQKVRPAIQRVALVPEHAGVLSHLLSATVAPLLFTKTGYPEDGDDVPSVLARAQFHLERRDLDGAARQLNQLKGWPKVLVEDWLQAARRRLEVEQHLDVASVEAHFASLQNA